MRAVQQHQVEVLLKRMYRQSVNRFPFHEHHIVRLKFGSPTQLRDGLILSFQRKSDVPFAGMGEHDSASPASGLCGATEWSSPQDRGKGGRSHGVPGVK